MFKWLTLLLLATMSGCASTSAVAEPEGETTLVWISLDGWRWDYLDRVQPPTMSRLASEGAVSRQMIPTYPSVTFPVHTSQITGRPVDGHGITGNGFHDDETGEDYSFPDDVSVLRAEPIWVTAKRQGLRIFVVDWPVSHKHPGKWAAHVPDFTPPNYDRDRGDEQRLADLMRLLQADTGDGPPRLIISYMSKLDSVGHRYGPDAPEIDQAVRDVDVILSRFLELLTAWFDETHKAEDELIVMLTTDHGMEAVHTLINVEMLLGPDLMEGVRVFGGTHGSIDLDGVPESERAHRSAAIVAAINARHELDAWPADAVPESLHYRDPSRIGDIVIRVAPGYRISSRTESVVEPARGVSGAHGYDAAQCPNMYGCTIVWRYREPLGGRDLGPIDATQFHATAAAWLGIEPAPDTDPRVISLDY